MDTPLFEGHYRSKRIVSLGGSSKKTERSRDLVEAANKEREERSVQKKRNVAATKIQAAFRGHVSRQQCRSALRSNFDRDFPSHVSHSDLLEYTGSLLVFYSEGSDHGRLMALCQAWIMFHKSVEGMFAHDVSGWRAVHLICRLLKLCCQSLFTNPSQLLHTPLRMLELFTGELVYGTRRGREISVHVLSFLLSNGYFSCLRRVMETKVPPPDCDSTSRRLLPLESSLLLYIQHPVDVCGQRALPPLLIHLLAPPLSAHLYHSVLPHLRASDLHQVNLLSCAVELVAGSRLQPSVELGFSLLSLFGDRLSTDFPTPAIERLLDLLSDVLRAEAACVRESRRQSRQGEEDNGGDFEDEWTDGAENMEIDPVTSRSALVQCLLDGINRGPLCRKICSVTSTLSLRPLSSLCYQLLSFPSRSTAFPPLLRDLAFSPPRLLRDLWLAIVDMKKTGAQFTASVSCLDELCHGVPLPSASAVQMMELLTLFATAFSVYLSSLHDAELRTDLPFSAEELSAVTLKLCDLFVALFLEKHLPPLLWGSSFASRQQGGRPGPFPHEWKVLTKSLLRLLSQLYDRNSRHEFCPIEKWGERLTMLSLAKLPLVLFLEPNPDPEDGPVMEFRPTVPQSVLRTADMLRQACFVFKFVERVMFFYRLVSESRRDSQGSMQEFLLGPSISVTARRTHLYQDAFRALAGEDLRKKLRVRLVNEHGLDEMGIDGGGLFREFLSETLKTGFDPQTGYFCSTTDRLFYPNPNVANLVDNSYEVHYEFLGTLLGKALYENLLVELPLAPFFLRKLTTPGKGWVDTHHLATLEPDIYRQLLWLKQRNEEEVEHLELTFSTVSNEYGRVKTVDLKPNGRDVAVTRGNLIEYIHHLAHYYLNTRIERQFRAFRAGLEKVIPLQWLTIFNEVELQVLISGAQVPVDVDDLRANTVYSGDYSEQHQCIRLFWDAVGEFEEEEKRKLLMFVTACSRPPLLGFKDLHPPFTIHPVPETDRLPSASTCMNLLKLPMFADLKTMKERLLYAITSDAGFELS